MSNRQKLFILFFITIVSCISIYNTLVEAGVSHPILWWEEEDGSPSTFPYKVKVTNGVMTDNGDGTISLAFGKEVTVTTFTDEGINTAIDALGADGGTVLCPEGEYTIDGIITIDYNNTTIQGFGWGTYFNASTSTADVINLNGCDNVIIRDLRIVGKRGGGNQQDLIWDGNAGSQYIRLQNLSLEDSDDNGVFFQNDGSDYVNMRDCYVYRNDGMGVDVVTGEYSYITDNEFSTNGEFGIQLAGNYDIHVIGNWAHHNTQLGIYVGAGSVVIGNTCNNNGQQGIYTQGANQQIIGNWSFFNSRDGIYVSQGSYASVSGNCSYQNGNGYDGIELSLTTYASITGNVSVSTSDKQENGILLTNSDYNTITGNVCYLHDTSGIKLDANSTNNHVANNNTEGEAIAPVINLGANNIISNVANNRHEFWGDFAFEGATNDAYETLFDITDPTADRVVVLPDAGGTFAISATAPVTLNATTGDIGLTQNAGTDVTADMEEETHSTEHGVGGADTVFPADPNADKILKWDDDPGETVWADPSAAAATKWSEIDDADADATVAFAGFEQDISSTLDEANHTVLTITNTDADRANDTILFGLADNDQGDVNSIWMQLVSDADGTPSVDFQIAQSATATAAEIRLGKTGVIISDDADGALTIKGNSAGQDEDLTFNFDDTADTVSLSSSTGVGTIDFSTIALKIAEGKLADSSVITDDVKDDDLTHADFADTDQADTKCFTLYESDGIDNDDDLPSIWANKTANDFLITELWCETDTGTVTAMGQVDDGTPADVDSVDLVCDADEQEDTSLDGDTTVAAGEEFDWAVTSTASTPTACRVCITGNWVD